MTQLAVMSFDKARATLAREEEYLKDVKKAVEEQLGLLKVSRFHVGSRDYHVTQRVCFCNFLEAEEVVLGRLVQHHSQASQQRQLEQPFLSSSSTPNTCPATSTGGSHEPVSTALPPSEPAQAMDVLPELHLEMPTRPIERLGQNLYDQYCS